MQKIQIIGNITRDAVMTDVNGRKAINLSVAVNESYKDADGNKIEKASFYSCAYWRDSEAKAGILNYLKKGVMVFVEGTPSAGIYKNKENVNAIDFKIHVKEIKLLSSPKKDEPGANTTGSYMSSAPGQSDDLPF